MVEKIQQVVSVLSSGGIRAKRGYPEETYFHPSAPVAAVYLDSAKGEEITVAAQIFATRAADCEDCADTAFSLLGSVGDVCMVESCKFDQKMGLFSLRVLVRWEPKEEEELIGGSTPTLGAAKTYTVYLNEIQMPYVTAFSASFRGELYQNVSEETGETEILYTDQAWALSITEMLPLEAVEQSDAGEPFTISLVRNGVRETYGQCRWDSVRRTETAEGVRQWRLAKTWAGRTVT